MDLNELLNKTKTRVSKVITTQERPYDDCISSYLESKKDRPATSDHDLLYHDKKYHDTKEHDTKDHDKKYHDTKEHDKTAKNRQDTNGATFYHDTKEHHPPSFSLPADSATPYHDTKDHDTKEHNPPSFAPTTDGATFYHDTKDHDKKYHDTKDHDTKEHHLKKTDRSMSKATPKYNPKNNQTTIVNSEKKNLYEIVDDWKMTHGHRLTAGQREVHCYLLKYQYGKNSEWFHLSYETLSKNNNLSLAGIRKIIAVLKNENFIDLKYDYLPSKNGGPSSKKGLFYKVII